MILNDLFLNQRISVEDQKHEIARIQEAPVGSILFTANTWENSDVIETLLSRGHIKYTENVCGGRVNWVKAS